ncbi:VOC family protein [Microbacterium sp. STN6]|uniref:VOC family protein n=1 Tax=Microbacterium sp. STN6 TaxID=2995588 RepID=UPI00226098C6|nr:VOC family protein [Microbacterium sp. STN6]MCX7522594.1 VOC family protein [Microbacterium sp. STN6]
MTAPQLRGIHHVTLTVSNLDASVDWYARVLGFELIARAEQNGLHKAVMRRDSLVVSFVQHGEHAIPGPFTERRTGLDHLSFAIAEQDLEPWQQWLSDHGVTQSPIAQGMSGRVLSFRDPDNIALELYTIN